MNKGQGMVEYAVLFALIVLVVVGALQLLGVSILNLLQNLINVLS